MKLDELKQVEADFFSELHQIQSLKELDALRVKYLGAKSSVKLALRSIKNLPKEEQKVFAVEANRIATETEVKIASFQEELKTALINEQIEKEWLDLSLPGCLDQGGMIHPIKKVEDQCLHYLAQLGFELVEGNDAETAYYNFDALNIPKHHPARDMQDTFWLNDEWLLRTHTTSVQARVLKQKPSLPIKNVVVGRVYRNEAVDATHLAMFHQLDGFWIEEGLTLSHLKGITTFLAKKLYGENQRLRFKPKNYPYTEPSVGIDVLCHLCHGKGCNACHELGWVTIMGAGMVHPDVLNHFGYDPDVVSGIAFGWGISRMTSQFYKLSKLRPLYSGDLRLLQALNRRLA